MRKSSDFNRDKIKVKYEPHHKPIQKNEIIGKVDHTVGAYQQKENTNDLSPKAMPKNGDLVVVEGLSCPVGLENNAIYVRDLPDVREYDVWMPTYKFYVGQIVSFWKNGFQYDFQIQMSDYPEEKLGKFVLVNITRTEPQPGVGYRTSKSKMRPK